MNDSETIVADRAEHGDRTVAGAAASVEQADFLNLAAERRKSNFLLGARELDFLDELRALGFL